MSGLHTSLLTHDHAYTRSKTPWLLDDNVTVYGKLIHYLSGGGMRTFGRTVRQEEVHRKHVRFYITSAILTALWLTFYFV